MYLKKNIILLIALVCVAGFFVGGCNADAGMGSLLSLKFNAEAEILPEGADVALKTDKSLKEELDHGKPTIRETQLEKYHAKNGLLEKKKSILTRDNQ